MKTKKKTKIIATIGPASDSPSKIRELMAAGVDVFRFNTKHSTIKWHDEKIKMVQREAKRMKKIIGIMIDLQGSETRIETDNQKDILIKNGDIVLIGGYSSSKGVKMYLSDKKIFPKLKVGNNIVIDDGLIKLKVIGKKEGVIKNKVIEGGVIKNRKGVNFPGLDIEFSSFIKRDIDFLNLAFKNNVTFVALSFVSSAKDIQILKQEMRKKKMKAFIIAKIENQKAIDNIDDIITESDIVMIARGDLGIEIPIERLAFWQKEIIKRCRKERTFVIVATQMLYSMVNNSRPTRAEVTDVANSVLDGTDAVMLSEETTIGKYPVKSVFEMSKILEFNEKNAEFTNIEGVGLNPTEFIVGGIAKELEKKNIINQLKIKMAVVFTEYGYTARVVSSFRSKIRVTAITNNRKVAEFLTLSYGVDPYYTKINFKNFRISNTITKDLKKNNYLVKGDVVAVFHGHYEKNPELLTLFSLTRI